MFCSKCGKEVEENATVCPECGESMVAETKEAAPKKVKGKVGVIVMLILSAVVAINLGELGSASFWMMLIGAIGFIVGVSLKQSFAKWVRVGGMGLVALSGLLSAFPYLSMISELEALMSFFAYIAIFVCAAMVALMEVLPKQAKLFGTIGGVANAVGVIAAVAFYTLTMINLIKVLAGASGSPNMEYILQLIMGYSYVLLYFIFVLSMVARMKKVVKSINE